MPRRGRWISPEAVLVITFAGLILVGAALLRMPLSHGARTVGTLDALFTATSAVCVTGLATVDTATDYSRAGQAVILILIQLGGLGIMTFAAIAVELFGGRVSLSSQAALQDVFFQSAVRGHIRSAIRRIIVLTLVIELAGALLLLAATRHSHVVRAGAFEAVFHSVSAFCNAGFALYSANLTDLRDNATVLWTVMGLIVLGGIGYTVILESGQRLRRLLSGSRSGPVHWTLHARVVGLVSGLLIVGGAALLLATGLRVPGASGAASALAALFHSVSARTAGFNTLDIGALPVPTLLVLVGLMFIGGSPGSCAGGIKTTSAAVWSAHVAARLRGSDDVTLMCRRIPGDIVRRAGLVLAVAGIWNTAGVLILSLSESARPGVRLEQLIFEQVSAFATVGLSTGITPALSPLGKVWIILTMFVGRLGPLTVALAVLARPRARFDYPQEGVMIG